MDRKLVFSAVIVALLAGCTTAPDSPPAIGSPAQASPSTAKLDAYHWDLARATSAQGQAIAVLQPQGLKPLRVDFTGDRVGISGGCNRIGGSARHGDGVLHIGPLVQTEMACADRRLMDLDAAIGQRLSGQVQARITDGEPPQLALVAANGDRLEFTGTPTAEMLHGGPGTTVFLEVAAQRVPCSHPLIPDMQCLQVRERTYAANGTVASQGEWQPLYQEIEGYTHVPGTRNVLRLKKFAVKDPPADASSVAYVLDMVVESELVGK